MDKIIIDDKILIFSVIHIEGLELNNIFFYYVEKF